MSVSFPEQVSAVSPLNGGAIDGAPRPQPKRARKPAREPMDRSRSFFCSNPQCDHATWGPVQQAQHMAREFWVVAQALVKLAPESPEAMLLTGGVILADLTDEECRAAHATYRRATYQGARLNELPLHIALRRREYDRRQETGVLSPAPPKPRQKACTRAGHLLTDDNVYVDPQGRRACRECRRERKRAHPQILSPEQRAQKNAQERVRYARKKAEREAGAP